jgi:hypothetical protein
MSLYTNKYSKRGQALVELGVMGAILIFLMGVLISYALRSNFQQRVNQMTFRKAMASAAGSLGVDNVPMGVSHSVIRERYIPDPSSIFGTGPVNPFSASSSVTRDYRAGTSAQNDSELPRTEVDIQGEVHSFRSAGFTTVANVDEYQIEDYYSVFGESNVFIMNESGTYVENNGDNLAKTCAYYGFYECALWSYNSIRILDYCSGELYDYGSCHQQCSDMDGYSGITDHGKPSYCSNLIDQPLINPSYTQTTNENNQLVVNTSKSSVETKDTFNWDTTTTRTLQPQNAGSIPVSSKVEEKRVDVKNTPW